MKRMISFLSALLAIAAVFLLVGMTPGTVHAQEPRTTLEAPVIKASNVASSGKIKLTWEKVEGAVKYEVHRATSKNGDFTLKYTTDGTSYTNTGAKAGSKYYYYVVAIAKDGTASQPSEIISRVCKLPRPVISVGNVASSGKIRVTWEAVEGAAEYEVYRATSKNGNYTQKYTTNGTSYTNTGTTAGKTYYYKVKAIAENTNANSAYSSAKYRTCDLPRPEVSISLSDGKPRLRWDAVSGAVEYEVYRATSKNGDYALKYTTTGTSYTNTGAKDGKTYYYKVKAIHSTSTANSAYSAMVSIQANSSRQTCYVKLAEVTLFVSPNSSSDSIRLPYMTEVQLGEAVSSGSSKWYEVYYQGDCYYVYLKPEEEKFTTEKSDFTYIGQTEYQQQVLDLAMYICQEWDTVYAHGQSDGVMNEDGTYGFDCSGFVSYVLNTVMEKAVPTYRLSANLTTLYETQVIYNEGYPGEFSATDVDLVKIQPGDVLFFSTDGELAHCGIYLGNGEFVHSTSTWDDVVVSPLSGSYEERLMAVRCYLPEKATPANTVRYINTASKLYAERSGDSEVLCTIPKGSAVTVLYTKTDNMAYVRIEDGTYGFVWIKYLSEEV